ncbi:hypothetical protein RHGRI_009082 [Rhododendron griersonianum]|uniref:Uncharacterized protein n=1 Tax=Rhododendron griersonianum TaxID=479676 RepID=A0AAV6L2W1_9ERIC|nr:hypothetical protein RHGRI_009082 [Rhododendron griersonianum]
MDLQRSVTSYRRSGSSGLVWDEKLYSGELKRVPRPKDEVDDQEKGETKSSVPNRASEIRLEQRQHNSGYRTMKEDKPTMEPPSPKQSVMAPYLRVILEGLKQYPPSTRFTKSELPYVFADILSKRGILSESGKNSTALSAATGSSELSSTAYPEAPILSDDPTPAPPGPTPTPSSSSLPELSRFGSATNEPLTLPSSLPTELPAPPLSDDSPLRRSTRAYLHLRLTYNTQ